MTTPTPRDIHNAALRQEIADRQNAEYQACLALATELFGPGYIPSGRQYLVDKDEEARVRGTGGRMEPAAEVFSVRNRHGEKRHFMVIDGKPQEVADYNAGFGDMLDEPYPTHTIEVKGKQVHPARYSLYWAGFEQYHPKTAVELAEMRERREEEAAEREFQKAVESAPLFAEEIRREGKNPSPKGFKNFV